MIEFILGFITGIVSYWVIKWGFIVKHGRKIKWTYNPEEPPLEVYELKWTYKGLSIDGELVRCKCGNSVKNYISGSMFCSECGEQ